MRLDEAVDCTNAAGATAESLCTALDCGALPVHLDWIQCGPWCSPDEEGYGVSDTRIDSVNPHTSALNLTLPLAVSGLTNAWHACL